MIRATLDHVEYHTPTLATFWLKPDGPFSYLAGQFIELILDEYGLAPTDITRWFTLSSSPLETLLAVTTKLQSNSRTMYKKKLFALQPGDIVKISEPMGDFVLPKDPSLGLHFVCGGLGVTPPCEVLLQPYGLHKKTDIFTFTTLQRAVKIY